MSAAVPPSSGSPHIFKRAALFCKDLAFREVISRCRFPHARSEGLRRRKCRQALLADWHGIARKELTFLQSGADGKPMTDRRICLEARVADVHFRRTN